MNGKSASILVVEDEPIIALDLSQALESLGYTIAATVASAADALQASRRLHPDLVLMDIHLADESDGVTAARAIRLLDDHPVIFLSAYDDAATLERVKVTEPYGFLVKPFNERALRAAIEMALYRHARDRDRARRAHDLEQSIRERAGLPDLLTMCASCRRLADGRGGWLLMETFLLQRLGVRVSHGLCRECVERTATDAGLSASELHDDEPS
jgi:two-component system, response regulator PdtaR